ncbi:protein-lysine methyltransferase METTL21D, partial [Arabidopsis lyrata subsp. lyrata]|uniref:protein-lysine methyltransferase METTL21D n=1 Tax=Arabidopsis lyrata subsp. lyrata TaxID=81972 RepID=UPI000A29E6B5
LATPSRGLVKSMAFREDDDDVNLTKMGLLQIGENEEPSEIISSGESEFHMNRINSIESTVVIRQLPSQGIAFKLWLPATTLVTLLDNYRRDPNTSPLTRTFSSFQSDGSDSSSPINIFELGSGTGIVGIAAAATLGANVTVTDLPNVIENLKFNVDANAEVVARFGGKVHVASLRWGEINDVEVLGQNVDLILASDVVYHERLYDPLLKTLRFLLLEGSKREFLMAHLKRWKKESIFFKKARRFFDVDVIHCDDPQEGSRIGVVVYRFAPKNQTFKKMMSNV